MISRILYKSKTRSVAPLLGKSDRPQPSMLRRRGSERGGSSNFVSIKAGPLNTLSTTRNTVNSSFIFRPTELPNVPVYYPIATTSRIIEVDDNNTESLLLLPQIASRIMNCLRGLSISAQYDNTNARASLTTMEGVQMKISLWHIISPSLLQTNKKRSSSGMDIGVKNKQHHSKILVELQRCNGDSMIFHKYSRYILNTVAGSPRKRNSNFNFDNDDDEIEGSGAYNNRPNKRQKHNNNEEPKPAAAEREEERENTLLAMEGVYTLLTKDRIDAKQLGLETLLFMTDPHKNGGYTLTKFLASQVVLFGTIASPEQSGNKDSPSTTTPTTTTTATIISQEIHEIILELVSSHDEQEEDSRFRSLALSIFVNALDVVTASGDNNNIHKMKYYKSLVSALVTGLSRATQTTTTASSSPNSIYLLIRCLRLLLSNSDKSDIQQQILVELGGEAAENSSSSIHRAMNIGVHTHHKLEFECKKFLKEVPLK